ncbi:MAG: V8-like Glu-specific endopeptidase [Thermoproteota archaeon]|jgi:V8-like Glu-specific endopeptidase
MKNKIALKLSLFISLLFLMSHFVYAVDKVIYGIDNREDIFEANNSLHVKLSKSTAGMIPNRSLKVLPNGRVELKGSSLEDNGKCSDEPFAKQPTAANCSGFLVDEDKLVTAGHCMQSFSDCENNSWVFDYKVKYSDQKKVIVSKKQVYKCVKIISQALDSTKDDYALIQLERVVSDRDPLKFRREGQPSVGDRLVVIGHPSGLPSKIAAGAKVRSVNNIFMVTNLDTYAGNSGSAVFNADSGLLEGILVRGDTDYVYSSSKNCMISNRLASEAGRGEDVTLIGNIKELASITEPIEPEPTEPVDQYTHLSAWIRWLFGL